MSKRRGKRIVVGYVVSLTGKRGGPWESVGPNPTQNVVGRLLFAPEHKAEAEENAKWWREHGRAAYTHARALPLVRYELDAEEERLRDERLRDAVVEAAAERVGLCAMLGDLHDAVAQMVQCIESGSPVTDDAICNAKSLLVRTAKDVPSWDNARAEVAKLLATASEVPGLSATLEVTRWERDRAVALLHMMDNHDARHPDVAEFLDMVTSWS